MYEFLAHPITLLCLGVVFILVALLFFYFKRTFSLLERAQMEQARVLQSFISNMEMNNLRLRQMAPGPVNNTLNSTTQEDMKLINVSDDEKSEFSSDSDDYSQEEDTDDESSDSNSIIDIHATEEVSDNNKDIKIIQLENSNLEEVNDLEIEELGNSDVDDDDDDDDDDEDDSSDEDENKEGNIEEIKLDDTTITQNLEPVTLDTIKLTEVPVDFKIMSVSALKTLAKEKGLIIDGEKKTKKELIKLLEEQN
jgi:hypothetical protein